MEENNVLSRQDLALLRIVTDFSREIAEQTSLSGIIQTLLFHVVMLTGAEQAALLLVDGDAKTCHVFDPALGLSSSEVNLALHCPFWRVFEGKTRLYWDANHAEEKVVCRCTARLDSYLGIPMMAANRMIGVIEAVNLGYAENRDQQAALMEEFSKIAIPALMKARYQRPPENHV
jgi:hypothetical protein